jgi:predicted nucleic acid-binding protein
VTVFVDTWAWIALALKRDQYHLAAMAQHQEFVKQRRQYVTTNFVLSELITQLNLLLAHTRAQEFVAAILTAADTGDYRLVHISANQFRLAWDLRKKYHDKPDISFVDFTSMAVMQDLGIVDVFTGDTHFRQVNLGFQLFP